MAYTGLCGTDLHIVHGHMDARISPPQVIGHEMSGTIAAIGDQVDGLERRGPGDGDAAELGWHLPGLRGG